VIELEAALRAQLERRAALLASGARHVGWKVGATIAEVDAVTGGAPAIGYLTTATVFDDGALYRTNGGDLYAETELVLDGDGDGDGYAVGLEIVDTARPPEGLLAIVAGNVFHRAAVLGPPRTHPPGAQARLWIDGQLRAAAPVGIDPAAVRGRVAALLETLELRLEPGDRVLAGSLTHVPVAPGQTVWAEIDGLGRVALTLASRARGSSCRSRP
jgi:2-keto-4-pentenoate hydratase